MDCLHPFQQQTERRSSVEEPARQTPHSPRKSLESSLVLEQRLDVSCESMEFFYLKLHCQSTAKYTVQDQSL